MVNPEDKAEPHLCLTCDDVLKYWKQGLYTPAGYLYHLILASRKTGWWLRIGNIRDFCKQWELNERTFYRAKAKLIADGYLEEKIFGAIELRVPLLTPEPFPLSSDHLPAPLPPPPPSLAESDADLLEFIARKNPTAQNKRAYAIACLTRDRPYWEQQYQHYQLQAAQTPATPTLPPARPITNSDRAIYYQALLNNQALRRTAEASVSVEPSLVHQSTDSPAPTPASHPSPSTIAGG